MSETTSLISPMATGFYCHFFKAVLPHKPKASDKPKFSGTFLFTSADMATPEFKAIEAAVRDRGIAKWGAKYDTMVSEGVVKSPFRKDVKSKGYPAEFACYVNATSGEDYPPAVKARLGGDISDPREFYHGVKLRVSLSTRAYGGPGTDYGAGVALDLRNVQKLGDGARISRDGGANADEEFGSVPLPPAPPVPAAAALDDMMS